MVDFLNNLVTNANPGTMIILFAFSVTMLLLLPRAVRKMGIRKLAGVEIHADTEDYTLQYNTSKDIDEVDTVMKERLWEYTEDLFMDYAESSTIKCEAIVNSILGGVFNKIRAVIMINHLVERLAVSNEEYLKKRLTRHARTSLNGTLHAVPASCVSKSELSSIDAAKYGSLIDTWIAEARRIVVAACRDKIEIYEKAIDEAHSIYWKNVFDECIAKNKEYIKGMER